MRRGFAVGALIAAAVVVAAMALLTMSGGSNKAMPGSAGVRTGNGTLQGRDFQTTIPGGWQITTEQLRPGEVRSQVSSTSSSLDRAGVPLAGSVGITISDVPTSVFAKGAVSAPDPFAVLQASAHTPAAAKTVVRVQAPRASTLGGAPAAEEVFTYTYKRTKNVQVDVVAQHAGRSLLIELDAEPALGRQSETALELLASGWRWR